MSCRFVRYFQIKAALRANFPRFDVLEFVGTDRVDRQLKMFATTAVIVAPHGAGLANMLVAPLYTPVLEIAPMRCPPCYTRLALKVRCCIVLSGIKRGSKPPTVGGNYQI